MKHIASWSGGKDSTATIILAKLNNEPLDEIVMSEVMFDLKRGISGELPNHIEWVYSVAKPTFEKWGYKVNILHSEIDYISAFYHKLTKSKHNDRVGKYVGFAIGGMCMVNRDCKMKPIRKYLKDVECIEYVGIASDEPKRLARLKDNKVSLLDKYHYTEQMAYELCKKYDLLSPTYENSFRGGCWFCPNARTREYAYIKQNYPDLWNELVIMSKCGNLASQNFKYGKTFNQVNQEVDAFIDYQKLETNQITMEGL